MDKYSLQCRIGGGAYGEVFKGTRISSGESIALKKIKTDMLEDGIPATALREIVFLRQLQHENIVRLLDIVMEPGKYSLIFEFMDGDLFFLLQSAAPNPLAEDLIQVYRIT